MTDSKPIVILGAGISGLASAYYLVKKGFTNIVILEKEKEIGGVGGFFKAKTQKFYLDNSYHVIFKGDNDILDLLQDLKLNGHLQWFSCKTAFFNGENIISFSGPLDILKNPKISLLDKYNFAKVFLKLKYIRNWRELDKITASSWLKRNCSPSTYQNFFAPILNVKWGNKAGQASAAWLWGRLNPRSRSRNTLGGAEKVGYLLPNGFQHLFSTLNSKLKQKGVKIYTQTKVNKIIFQKDKICSLNYTNRGKIITLKPKVVISTISASTFIKISRHLPPSIENLKKIQYQGVICTTISLPQKLTQGFYQIPFKPGISFCGGIVEHTNAIKSTTYQNQNLIYVFKYLSPDSSIFSYSDKKIIELNLKDINLISSKPISAKEILWHRVYRSTAATPIYSKNFLQKISVNNAKNTNLFFAGMANTYPMTDYNCSIKLARRIVDDIMKNICI